jgi:hypothetical protein
MTKLLKFHFKLHYQNIYCIFANASKVHVSYIYAFLNRFEVFQYLKEHP